MPSVRKRPIAILAVPGSVRRGSLNLRLLRTAARSAPESARVRIFDQPELCEIPPYDPDLSPCEPADRFRAAVGESDAVLVATPEYHASIPGGLKNAIDWAASPPEGAALRGKPAAVIGADRSDFGGDWGQADARKVLEAAGARVIDHGLAICHADRAFDDQGELRDAAHSRELEGILGELIAETDPS